MRQYLFLGVIFGTVFMGFSQQIQDSIYNPVNQKFSENIYRDFEENALNLSFLPLKNFTASSLSYTSENGSYKEGQIPESEVEFGVKTNGLYRNKKGILFFGDFSIYKSYYKNLKWNLSYELPERGLMEDPHYFGVAKGASWNNQLYDLNGGLILPVFSNKLNILVQTDYHLYNKFRTDLDPRTEITANELNFTFGFSYTVKQHHHFKAAFNTGYKHVNNDIDFSNDDQNVPANYDIYVKWLSGYGSISSPFKNETQRRYKKLGVNFGYTYTIPGVTILADINYSQSEQITYRYSGVLNTDDASNYFATYSPKNYGFNVEGLFKLAPLKSMKVKVTGEMMDATNYLQSKGGSTYAASSGSLKGEIAYLSQEKTNKFWDLNASVEWWETEQMDALSVTTSTFGNLEIGATAMRSFAISEGVGMSPYFSSLYRMNINSRYIQGNIQDLENLEENDFAGLTQRTYYEEVIIPNAEFYSKDALHFTLGTQFLFNQTKSYRLKFNLEGGIFMPLEELYTFEDASPERFMISTGLTLSY